MRDAKGCDWFLKGYFLRAFEAHSRDPLILLAFGVAYLHRAMQRQTDNRHHQIAQVSLLIFSFQAL